MQCDRCGKELKEGENVYQQYFFAEVPDKFRAFKMLCSQCYESVVPDNIKSEWEPGFVVDGGFYPYSND